MTELRFSLKSLLGAEALVGLTLAAFLQPWRSWCPALMLTCLVSALLFSVPVAIYARWRRRAFAVGFATVGWTYFLLAYAPWAQASIGRQLLAAPIAETVCFAVTGSLGDVTRFLSVTHAAFTFVLGFSGGLIAARCYTNDKNRSHDDETVLGALPAHRQNIRRRPEEMPVRNAT